ncbi:MAG: GTPase HflX [Planctomycetia bacterium]|nr:GTPase HflX [Planctomycetia bacterium]
MQERKGPKNPKSRDRDREKDQKHKRSSRTSSNDSYTSYSEDFSEEDSSEELSFDEHNALEDSPFDSEVYRYMGERDDDPYYRGGFFSTERFDASTQSDLTTRTTSVASERAILAGVYMPGQGLGDNPLAELAGLAQAASVDPVGSVIQRRAKPDVAYCLGKGKLEELKLLIQATDAQVVLFDLDLAPGQTRNLERYLQVKVIDRTELILDVFATRAQTREARLAVELAQLEYSLPRLKRMWTHLERQTVGGVGLRGPGEKQLEVDKRIAQKRIVELKRELDDIHNRKKREIAAREQSRRVCLVGYTNAGKSSLLNAMTQADVFARDMLFATLDTRTRRWFLPGWGPVLMSDTVGFVRDLPHHLVASFRATLEETTTANLLIHVADASAYDVQEQIQAAHQTLERLGVREKDEILVLNKIDAIDQERLQFLQARYPTAISVSVRERLGLDKLTAAVSEALSREFLDVYLELSVADGKTVALLARDGEITSREYNADGRAVIHCRLPKHVLEKLRNVPNVTTRLDSRSAEPLFDTWE